jgi:haloalkane dehalogenase
VTAVRHAAGLAYREAGPADGPAVLLVHGWPYSSYMWEPVLERLGAAGLRGVAPDLAGFGDSDPDPPGTWHRHAESLERLRTELELGRVALVSHDWGLSIALRWAADHRDQVSALVLSNGGAALVEGRWHPVAEDMRGSSEGEAFMRYLGRDLFDAGMRQVSRGMSDAARDEYWKCLADDARRAGALELFRSADAAELVPYVDEPARLRVPTLVLWGAHDDLARMSVAEHFQRITPGSKLVVLEDAGHAIYDDAPEAASSAVADFLRVELL